MNPSEELKVIRDEIKQFNLKIEQATLGKEEYNGISKEDRKEILIVLNYQHSKLEADKLYAKIELLNEKIEQTIFGEVKYKDRSEEDREKILVVLKAEKKSVKEEMNKRTLKDFLYL
jgi:hypothetical protein